MKQTILTQIGAAKWVFDLNTEGLTHEESLAGPESGNCLNWVAGHLVATLDRLLGGLGGEPVWSPEETEAYARGAEPLTDPEKAIDFERIRTDLGTATERALELIGGLSDDELAAPAPFSPTSNADETVGSLLAVLAFHQAYHTGQVGLLRRAAGRSGAIR